MREKLCNEIMKKQIETKYTVKELVISSNLLNILLEDARPHNRDMQLSLFGMGVVEITDIENILSISLYPSFLHTFKTHEDNK